MIRIFTRNIFKAGTLALLCLNINGPLLAKSENIINVTDNSFEEDVLKSSTPVLVDFWAEWCGPCKMFAPRLEEIAKEYHGRLTVAKINIDDNPTIPENYGVSGIPTLILFKNGQVVDQHVGNASKAQLEKLLEKIN
jgi:thioredoxin 1